VSEAIEQCCGVTSGAPDRSEAAERLVATSSPRNVIATEQAGKRERQWLFQDGECAAEAFLLRGKIAREEENPGSRLGSVSPRPLCR